MTLGQQIKEAREKKSMSQEELAEIIGVSRQAVSKWENDTAVPHGANREMLSQALELTFLAEPPTYKTPFHAWIGWGLAGLFFLVIVGASALILPLLLSYSKAPVQNDEIIVESIEVESPYIKSIRFYDSEANEVEAEAGWFNTAEIDTVMVQYGGGTLDSVQAFCTPTGTEMLEYTNLLLTKSVLDNSGVLLISADFLQITVPSGHLYFEFAFGSEIRTSEIFNVFYEKID